MNRKPAIGIGISVAIAALGLAAWASDSARTEKPAAVDAQEYADFMAHEALDVQDLAEGAEIQRRTFNRMTPPGLAWVQPMFPMAVPFDAVNFDDKFLDELLGDQVRAGRPKRRTDGHLAQARRGAGELEVGQIGAGNQKDKARKAR